MELPLEVHLKNVSVSVREFVPSKSVIGTSNSTFHGQDHISIVIYQTTRHPPVKWAQRSDELYITVELPDAQDVKLKLEPEGKFYFSATAGAEKIPYEIDIDLFDNIDVNNSKASLGSRNICYLVKKAENKWWDRLLKQGGKPPIFLKVDWDKWVDEDEEQDNKPASDMDFGDIDFSKLNMGGGGGMDFDAAGDDDDDESDTEDEVAAQASTGNELDTKDTAGGDPSDAPHKA